MLYRQIPFLRLYFPLCAGIIASHITSPSIFLTEKLIFLLFILLLGSYFKADLFENKLYGLFLTGFLFSAGFLSGQLEKSSLSNLKNEKTIFRSVLLDFPEEKEKTILMKVRLNEIIYDTVRYKVKGSVLLYHEKSDTLIKRLKPGDIMIFSCVPSEIKNRGNPFEFDYKFYMERKGFRYFAFTSHNDIILIHKPFNRNLRERALIFREKIVSLYRNRGLAGNELALAAAITLGEKELLEESSKESFSRAGVMHVMAVSGLHAGILSFFIFNIFFFLRKKLHIIRLLITLIVLWEFAFTTGLTPSVLRASLMFSFLHTGHLLGRKVNPVNSLFASAFILTISHPFVIFDSSFLLSYMAVLFILLFYKGFYNLLSFKNIIPDRIWQIISVSVVAQAGTLPLTLMMFNRFPLLFIISNLLIIPLAAVIIISGFLTILTGSSCLLSGFFAIILKTTSRMAGFVAERTSQISFASVENIGISPAESLMLTALLGILLGLITWNRKFNKLILPVSLLILLATSTIKKISSSLRNELIVYNIPGQFAAGIKSAHTLYLFYSGGEIPQDIKRHVSIAHLKIKPVDCRGILPFIIKAGEKTIVISEDIESINPYNRPDIIIITGTKPVKDISGISADEIIFTSGYQDRTDKLKDRHLSDGRIWYTRNSGCRRIVFE